MDFSPKTSPELLLPVGTREMLEAAIKNGADAVYFGVPHWNARGRTEDFTFDDVADMIRYARVRGVRTFLAMNVLIFERELWQLPEFLEKIISLKPDAFIIQDIGLARLIRAICPEQEIHASTQMTLSSAEGVNFVKSIGFNRAVLARELSVKEIASIKSATDLELEVFIHGALCVSYSGQCLTSENFGGRSANRGQCAQSCRLPYRIFVDGKEFRDTDAQYLFSTRDLCALPKLDELEEIGVNSLKVEGRLKSPEYVAAVSRAYRKALNRIPLDAKDMEPLEVLFSRGLNTGWLDGDNHQELVNGTFSNHHGLYLGTVYKVDRGNILIALDEKIVEDNRESSFDKSSAMLPQAGDGILFENAALGVSIGSRLYASQIAHVAHAHRGDPKLLRMEFGRDFDTRQVAAGMQVYRNDSPALERELRKTFTDRNLEEKKPIDMECRVVAGEVPSLRVSVGNKIATVQGETPLEASKNAETDKAAAKERLEALIRKELGGLSATPYKLHRLDIETSGNPFVPGKMLRNLRQEALLQLEAKALEWKPLHISATEGEKFLDRIREKNDAAKPTRQTISVLVRNPAQIAALKGLDIDRVIMDFDWGVKYDDSLQQIRDLGFAAGMATLRIHKPGESHYLKNILRLCPDFALVRNLGALSILKESGIPLTGDYSLNAANSASYDWLLSQGLTTLHPSWDLNSTQLFDLLENINGSRLELTLHQYMPAFHSEYCAFARALTTGRRFPECGKICTKHKVEILDHKGERHFLQSDAECRNTLFVGKPQSALKLFPKLTAAGVNHYRLEMLQEDAETVRRKVAIYTQAIRGKISIEEAIREAGIQEKYGLSEGQLFNESTWQDRKK